MTADMQSMHALPLKDKSWDPAAFRDMVLIVPLSDCTAHGLRVWAHGTLMASRSSAGLRVTDKADMFSFGVVLWELATREPARRGMLRCTVKSICSRLWSK
jgi:hypothetical protein